MSIMFCSYCGKKIADTASFCTYCGNAVSRSDISLMSMKCPECGASMDYSASKPILQCPFCGNKNFVVLNKEVQIAKINADASITNNKMRYDLNRDVAKMKLDRDIEVERIRSKKTQDFSGLWRLIEIVLSLVLILVGMVACFKGPSVRGEFELIVFPAGIVLFICAVIMFVNAVKKDKTSLTE